MAWRTIDALIDDVDRPAFGIWNRNEISDGRSGYHRGDLPKHGTPTVYKHGCRCAPCKVAHSAHQREYRARRRAAA